MKRFCFISIAAFLFLAIFQNGLTSCTKTNTVTKTVIDTFTVMQKDTLVIKDTALTSAILTANSWKPLQITALVSNSYLTYMRGGTGNTVNLDNEYITFASNGSGIYTDNSGNNTTFTWNFTDATNKSLIWNWNITSPSIKVTWEDLVYKNGAISYTEFYTSVAGNSLTSGTRIPR